MRPLAPLVIFSVLLSGCGDLILRDDDNALQISRKVLTRIVLAPATVGFSEMFIDEAKKQEAKAAALAKNQAECRAIGMIYFSTDWPMDYAGCAPADYIAKFQSLVAEHQRLDAQRRPQIDPIMGLLMLQTLQSTPRYQYQPLPVPNLTAPPPRGFTCFHNGQVSTSCY